MNVFIKTQIGQNGDIFWVADDAVRSRFDWKYALLCLGLTDPGFDYTVLSELLSHLAKRNKESYRHRTGTPGTHSQGTRTIGLRRSRYVSLHKTHLGHGVIAMAINLFQLMSWLRGEDPAQTRMSPFKQVMNPAA